MITFGTFIPPMLAIDDQIQLAQVLEAFGFDRLWFPDHVLFPDATPGIDCWTVMAAIAARTKRIELCPGVSDPHRIHPALYAQRLATLDQLSRGRMLWGVGSGEAMNLDPFGIPWKDLRVRRVKEFVEVVRGLLDSDEPLTYEGTFYHTDRAKLTVKPHRKRKIPLHLAALGPMMQRLAGRVADGWYPIPLPVKLFVEDFVPMAAAAREAGRDPEKIERCASLMIALDPDRAHTRQEVVKRVRPLTLTFVMVPALERIGFDAKPPAHLDVGYIEVNPCDEDSMARFKELSRWVPDEVLDHYVHHGDARLIRKVIGEYVDAGATHVNLINVSPEPVGAFIGMVNDVLPHFKKRPPTVAARVAGSALPFVKRLGLIKYFAPKMNMPES